MNTTTPPTPPRQQQRALLALGFSTMLALGGLWWWAGTPGSLGSTLRGIAWVLPSGQNLQTTEVQGSLRHGGQLAQLHWQQAGLHVQAQNITLQLDWSRLWQRTLPLTQLSIEQLRIEGQSPASSPQPLSTLQWPLRIDLSWQVDRIEVAGASGFVSTGLQGRYHFNGQQHELKTQAFELAQGRYTLQATLQATAPMALQASLQGQVQAPGTARTSAMTLDVPLVVDTASGPTWRAAA